MRRLLFLLLVLCSARAWAETPADVPNPLQNKRSWVADSANVLNTEEEMRVNAILSPLERETGAEVAVVLVHNLSGQDVNSWANDLFNRWKIGKKGKDNGVLFVAAIDDHKARIEVGYGLEGTITDGQAGDIQRNYLVPAFKQQNYSKGVLDVVGALNAKIRGINFNSSSGVGIGRGSSSSGSSSTGGSRSPGRSAGSFPGSPGSSSSSGFPSSSTSYTSAPSSSSSGFPIGLMLLGGVALVGGMIYLKTRPLRCANCEAEMSQLSDSEEGAYLSDEQKFEQNIDSVDWQVWKCPKCSSTRIVPDEKFFSSYTRCTQCGNRTARQHTRTIESATYTHGGEEEITTICEYPKCGHQTRRTRSTPRLQQTTTSSSSFGSNSSSDWGSSSSSSSDSGPSDFGGGSSGGGGASSDW